MFNPGPEQDLEAENPNALMESSDLSVDDIEAMKALTSHHIEDTSSVHRFTADVIDGRVPRLERGNLTLVAASVS